MTIIDGTCLQRIKQPCSSGFRYRQLSLQFSLPSSRIKNDQIVKAICTDRFYSHQRPKWFFSCIENLSPTFSSNEVTVAEEQDQLARLCLYLIVTNMYFKLCLLCQLINVTNNATARRRDKKGEKKFRRRIIIFIFQKQKRQGNPQSCFTDPPAALYRQWRFNCHLVALFERTNKLVSLVKSIMILNRPFRGFFLIRKNKSRIFAI